MNRGPAACVLIVDDNQDYCTSMAELLTALGYCAVACTDGHAALHYLQSHQPPGLILLDWLMPGMGGEQFLLDMFADPRLAAIPVIIITGYQAARPTAPAPGRYPILLKPVDIKDLLPMIEQYLGPPRLLV